MKKFLLAMVVVAFLTTNAFGESATDRVKTFVGSHGLTNVFDGVRVFTICCGNCIDLFYPYYISHVGDDYVLIHSDNSMTGSAETIQEHITKFRLITLGCDDRTQPTKKRSK